MLKTCFLLSRNRCRRTNKYTNSFCPYRSYKKFSTTINQCTQMRNLSTRLSHWFWIFLPTVRTKAAPLSLLKQHSQISFTKNSLWSGKRSENRLSSSTKVSSKFSVTSSKIRKVKWKDMKTVFKIWSSIFRKKKLIRWPKSRKRWQMKTFVRFVFCQAIYSKAATRWKRKESL